MIYLLYLLGTLSLSIFALLGLFTVFHWLRPQKSPVDTSNRINAIRLWWFALTREEMFAGLYRINPRLSLTQIQGHTKGLAFPWLRQDEKENVQ